MGGARRVDGSDCFVWESVMLGPCLWETCLCEGVLRVEFNCRQPMEGDGT